MLATLGIFIAPGFAPAQIIEFEQSWLEEESFPGAIAQDSAAAMVTYHDSGLDVHYVYVTGYASTPLGGRVFATHKYFAEPQNPQKAESTVYFPLDPTFVSTMHEAVAMAVNPDNGDVYITGTSRNTAGGATDTDFVIIKYDAGLNQVWERRIGTLENDRAMAIVLDYHDVDPTKHRVYVTATVEGFGTQEDILTVNLQAIDGQLSGDWADLGSLGNGKGMRRYDHPFFHGPDRASDMAYSIPLIDSFAHLYIVGTSWQGSRGDDIFVIAYFPNGDVYAPQPGLPGWPQYFDASLLNDTGVAIARDDEGTGEFSSPVFIAGTVERSSGPPSSSSSSSGGPLSGGSFAGAPDTDYVTIRYTNDGLLDWARGHSGPSLIYQDDVAVDIVTYGNEGQFIATTGNVRNGPLYDIETARYNQSGTILEPARFGNVLFNEQVTAMASAGARGTYLTGWIDYANLDLAPVSYLTMTYGVTWGTPDWWVAYPGIGMTDSKAFALAVGKPQGTDPQDVFVSGFSQRIITGEDNVTIRYVDNP